MWKVYEAAVAELFLEHVDAWPHEAMATALDLAARAVRTSGEDDLPADCLALPVLTQNRAV